MSLRSICKKAVLVISASLLIFSLGGKSEVASNVIAQTACGEWNLALNDGRDTSQDGKISIELLQSTDPDCTGKFILRNSTSIAKIGGYSLELIPEAQNASFVIIDTYKILSPGTPIDIVMNPKDPGKGASVKLQGQMTMDAYLYDFAFFAVLSIIKAAIPLCVIPHETIARTAVRVLNITSGAANLFANGYYSDAFNEFSRIYEAMLESIEREVAKDIIEGCGVFLVEKLTGMKLGVFVDIAKWLVPWYRDYFKGEWSYLTLSYFATVKTELTPEPTPTIVTYLPGDLSDPNYLYSQVKKAVLNKDSTYLQEFYDGDFEVGPFKIVSCMADGWVSPPLAVIEDHLDGQLKCEGIQYESGLLAIYYSGWTPDWVDCFGYESDNAAFLFGRKGLGSDFIFSGMLINTMKGYNSRCCGNPGVEPYNAISCDTEFISNFQQNICTGAPQQRLKIGERGTVCSLQGYATFHNTLPGDVDPSSPLIGQTDLPIGTEFKVLSGPYCNGDGLSWFEVWPTGKAGGYMAESNSESGEYDLCPLTGTSQLPSTPESTDLPGQSSCPGAPPQRLVVGNRAKVCSTVTSVKVRTSPGLAGSRLTSLPSNTEFDVIGGPVCAGNNWSWWEVRTDSGQVGWMAEGGDEVDPYFLCPIAGNPPVSTATAPIDSTSYPTPTGLDPRIDYTDMIYIPAGEFQMGCDENLDDDCQKSVLPPHSVFVDAYFIDKYEVTNGEYKECVEMGICDPPEGFEYLFRYQKYANPEFNNYPVSGVDPNNASAFCSWWGKRLPSESEWEKAARGTIGITFPWGDEKPNCSLANFGSCADGETMPVGSYPAGSSPYGVMDMAGNVEEWMWSMFDTGWVVRGGGCDSLSLNDLETYNRVERAGTAANMGFRCVIDAEIKD